MALDVTAHRLVPKHKKLSDSQKEKLLKELNLSTKQLPKILPTDPAIAKLGAKEGDIIAVERISQTAGKSVYYRVVLHG